MTMVALVAAAPHVVRENALALSFMRMPAG